MVEPISLDAIQPPSFEQADGFESLTQPALRPAVQQRTQPEFRSFLDVKQQRQYAEQSLLKALGERQFENTQYQLRLADVKLKPRKIRKRDEKIAAGEKGTLHQPVQGRWELVDKATGQVVDKKKGTVAYLPHMTDRGTYMVNGTAYVINHQSRLRPGVYTRKQQNGLVESQFNIEPRTGKGFRFRLDPESGRFKIRIQQGESNLYPLLRAVGFEDEDLRKAWGDKLFEANRVEDRNQADLKKTLKRLGVDVDELNPSELEAAARERIEGMGIDPEVMEFITGQPIDKVNRDLLLSTTTRMLGVLRGDVESDDRDSMAFQTIHGPEDFFAERINKDAGKVGRKILWKATKDGSLKRAPSAAYRDAIYSLFNGTGLAQTVEDTNPIEIADLRLKLSRMGEGALRSTDAAPRDARGVQPSHYGLIDGLRTPECHDEFTEVMTDQGWVSWKDVTPETRFACLVGGWLQYHRAEKLVAEPYQGPMYGAKTATLDYLVTPNHRMWVRTRTRSGKPGMYRIESAEQVHQTKRTHRSAGHSPLVGGGVVNFTLPKVDLKSNAAKQITKPLDIYDWCSFLGWYLSEGNTNGSRTLISQSKTINPVNCAVIAELLGRLPFTWNYSETNRAFVLSVEQLAAYLRQFGKCYEKFIPDYVFKAPIGARQAFVDAYLAGDGRSDRQGRKYGMCTTSERMAHDFHRLLFELGVSSRVVFEPDDREERYHGCWIVQIHSRTEREVQKKSPRHPYGQYYTEQYDGIVYCATVPGGLLYTRRNNSCGFWSGNSDKIGLDMRVAWNTFKGRDNKLYTATINKAGKTEIVSAPKLLKGNIGFAGEMDRKDPRGKVRAMVRGKIKEIPRSQVDYWIKNPEEAYAPTTNMVPFFSSAKAQRTLMGARMSVSGDTAVLVRRADGSAYQGPIEDYEWRDGDRSLSIDKQSYQLEWKPVQAKIQHKNVKRMHRVTLKSGRFIDATDDHSFVTLGADGTLQKVHTQDLVRGCPIPIAGDVPELPGSKTAWEVQAGNKHNAHPAQSFPLDFDLGWIHGIYLAEGYLTSPGRGGEHRGLSFGNCDLDVLGRIRAFFDSVGVPCQVMSGRSDGVLDRARVGWKQFAQALAQDYGNGSYNKALPGWVFFAPRPFREGLLAGYLAGDGGVQPRRKQVRVSGSSRSKDLIVGFGNLCASLGIATREGHADVMTGPKGSAATQHYFEVRTEHIDRLPELGCAAKDGRIQQADAWSGKKSADWLPMYEQLRAKLCQRVCGNKQGRHRLVKNSHTRASVAELFRGEEYLVPWLSSGVWWDAVRSVQELDKTQHEYVYDLDMADNVFMCGNGVFVHNTTQALPLVEREAPLVQSAIPGDERSFDALLGEQAGATRAEVDGVVTKVTKDEIHIKKPDGETEVVDVYDELPMNRLTNLNQTLKVEPGQRIRKGDLLATSNFTDDDGVTAMGRNLRVGYISHGGATFEDAVVISEAAAAKLAAETSLKFNREAGEDVHATDVKTFRSLFPTEFDQKQLKMLDDEGVIKKGQVVHPGDPLLLQVDKVRKQGVGSIMRGRKTSFRNESQIWEHNYPGQVVDVFRRKNGSAKVVVRSILPAKEGDKLSGRYGDKGVISKVLPDDQMPQDSSGPLDILVSPAGISSRSNPSQVAEALYGKLAEIEGKPALKRAFREQDEDSIVESAIAALEKAGLKSEEDLIDPVDDRRIKNVLTGNRYYMRLHHLAEKKLSARDTDEYTVDDTPAKGGPTGAKRLSLAETASLLSAGATEVLRDAKLVRGQRNDDYWRGIQLGYTPSMPTESVASKKFLNQLKSAGVNIVGRGENLYLMPISDKEIKKLTQGRKVTRSGTFNWDTMEPVKGGLFDVGATGGNDGTLWASYELPQPVLNPIMQEPVQKLLGMSEKDLRSVLAGSKQLDGRSGPTAVQAALKRIGSKLDDEISSTKQLIAQGSKSKRDAAVKRLRYLESFKKMGFDPSDAVISSVPVLPPKYRPVSAVDSMTLIADPNYLYSDMIGAADNLKEAKDVFGDDGSGDAYLDLYDSVKAVTGLGQPVSTDLREKKVKGILAQAVGIGRSPKRATFQRRIVGTAVDQVGRAVIAPDPKLSIDQIGIPKEMAWTQYRKYVVRKLVQRGMPATQAVRAVLDRNKPAQQALEEVMDERPIFINRAPTLHRHSIIGGRPVLVDGDAIKLSPPVEKGLGADHDGDAVQLHVPSTDEAVRDVYEKLMPSQNLRSPSDFGIHMLPENEFISGIYAASQRDKKKRARHFESEEAALRAYMRGEISVSQPISIADS